MYITNIMKHNMKWAAMIVAGAAMMFACKSENTEEFETISEGLSYKVEKANPSGQQVQNGDVLVGEMTVTFEDETLYDTKGQVRRIAMADPSWDVMVGEELTRMHVGEVAVYALDADVMAKYLNSNQMPPAYKPGNSQKVYYTINLQDIVTHEELMEEQENYVENMKKMEQEEPDSILSYVKKNKITAKPNDKGLYVVVKKKGNGPKVAMGKEVSIHYTGRLLDGTVFDSSVGKAPLTYVVGKMGLIAGWEEGVKDQPAGTQLQLIIPSALAYGPQGRPGHIPPYSPLVFDLEIVSVK